MDAILATSDHRVGAATRDGPPRPDLTRHRWRLHFRDPGLEAAFRLEQSQRALNALRSTADAGAAVLVVGVVVLIGGLRVAPAHPVILVLAGIGGVLLLFRGLAGRESPRLAVLLPIALATLALGATVIMPVTLWVALDEREVLGGYGYAGPMLASIMVFLLLRLPLCTAAIVNALALGTYAVLLSRVPWVPFEIVAFHAAHIGFAMIIGGMGAWALERMTRDNFAQHRQLEWQEANVRHERERSESLLLNVLPAAIAERLKAGESPIADAYDAVTVLFADIVGFTLLSRTLPAPAVVELLDRLFRRFDELSLTHGAEKIKTIGDAYMVVLGAPRPGEGEGEGDVAAAARLALAMRAAVDDVAREENQVLDVRIGIDTGPAVAGVIGQRKFAYDLWGVAVNTASRMESHGEPGRIQVTEAVAARLGDDFTLAPRGEIQVKGQGATRTWWLEPAPERPNA